VGRQLGYVIGITLVAIAGIVYTLAVGNEPLLGLDLQGGASVVLEPKNTDGSEVTDETLDQAVEIIRNRVDGLGVREPEITRQGNTILVQIPGVEDQARAIDLVGQTAELRFRPVLSDGTPGVPFDPSLTSACANSDLLASGGPTPDAVAGDCMIGIDKRNPTRTMLLGPAPRLIAEEATASGRLNGEALESASARFQLTEWTVNIAFRSGSPGIEDFNRLAASCAGATNACPAAGVDPSTGRGVGRIAIEIDGVIESSPTVGTANFDRDAIVISGGAMGEQEAKDLALVLRFGALPVELEAQESRIVSSTLGEDALDAGIVAGAIGLALVSLYLVAYSQLLGIVAI